MNGLLPINLAYTHERTDETKQSWLKKVSVSIQRDKADGRAWAEVVVSYSFDGRRRRGIRGLRALEDDAVVVQGGAR